MSRQFDEYMEGRFEINGEEYKIIDPSNAKELAQAFDVKSAIETQISTMMHDEDSSGYQNLLQEQEDYINEYIDSLGVFDSSTLSSNLTYLCKQIDMRIGGLEETLRISPGYISRAIGENSKKKMSIDTIWKISKLFDVGIDTLIERKLGTVTMTKNEHFILDIIESLIKDCEDCKMSWIRETPKEMESKSFSDGPPDHPLMKDGEYYEMGAGGYPEKVADVVEFNSQFFSDNFKIELMGNCYHADLPKTDTSVYIAHIRHYNESFVPDEQYELYTINKSDGKITPVCGSLSVKEEISKALERLYKTVDEANATISMPKELRSTFEFYLSNKEG